MSHLKHYIFDFDSTFTQVEALDELGRISLRNSPDAARILGEIKETTNRAMAGKLSFRESLEKRLDLLNAHRDHLPELIEVLSGKISKSIARNVDFFKNNSEDIFIISNGFKDFIEPIVAPFGIPADHVFANEFIYDPDGKITGFDKANVLTENNGKAKQIGKLNLQGEIHVIGDGHTDFEIKLAGVAHKFYAFTENVHREEVASQADHVTPSFDEYLYTNRMNTVLSYPKNRIKVLLLENINPAAQDLLSDEGYTVEVHPGGMDEEELCESIRDVSVLGIRSKTQVTARVLENARKLLSVGAFCIGTNQIDLVKCMLKGVTVFNAPYSNTRSVVELAIGNMIMLIRNLPDKIMAMHKGSWQKSAARSFEIRGKRLGIVGYGNIGTQLSVLAESLGMNIFYYDLEEKLALGNATKCNSLAELLSTVDIVSLHVDGRPDNLNLISAAELKMMKEGAILINLSRGHVVDIKALSEALDTGHIAGAAIGVKLTVKEKVDQEKRSEDDIAKGIVKFLVEVYDETNETVAIATILTMVKKLDQS
jgi:D-3-phosphoglycerate dehydrogenase